MLVKRGVGAGVRVYLLFKECCFRVRVRVRVRVRWLGLGLGLGLRLGLGLSG